MVAKALYWCAAILICAVVGMAFPGIGHAVLGYVSWRIYCNLFKDASMP